MAINAHSYKGLIHFPVLVTLEDKRLFKGKLVELDDQNLVIETRPGFEKVIRTAQVTSLKVAARVALQ